MGAIAAAQPQYRVTFRVVFAQEAAFFTKNAFSVASAFNPQRIFTEVQSAIYWHWFFGGSHYSGPRACLAEFNAEVCAFSDRASPKSL